MDVKAIDGNNEVYEPINQNFRSGCLLYLFEL